MNYCERLCAPERMTDGRQPFRQISGNLQEFQAAIRELKRVMPKAVTYEGFVEGRLEARKPNIARVAEGLDWKWRWSGIRSTGSERVQATQRQLQPSNASTMAST